MKALEPGDELVHRLLCEEDPARYGVVLEVYHDSVKGSWDDGTVRTIYLSELEQ